MYEVKLRKWIFSGDEEKAQEYCRTVSETEDSEILFYAADYLLSRARREERNIDGVFCMEQAAGAGNSSAMYAMGQMAEYGWAVGKSRKNAVKWYRRAAKAGNSQAKKAVRRMRRRRILGCAAAGGVLLAAAAVCLAVLPVLPGENPAGQPVQEEREEEKASGRGEVLVGEDTQLDLTDTLEEFNESVRELSEAYDDELVVSGERSTNRLILHFEGEKLDLTEFLADRVIARENNMVVIQFASEEEARQCIESLKRMEEISFVEMDEYNISGYSEETGAGQTSFTASGSGYYTWGCEDMGLDRLAAYLSANAVQQSATVAVLDTGVMPAEDTSDRILSGTDVVMGGDGCSDLMGHGTHVSGTILDCTRGLDVKILPVGIFGENEYTSTLYICTGLEYAIGQSPDVINMSLGGPVSEEDGWHQTLIREAVQNGITVVVSAGNGDEAGNPMDTDGIMPAAMEECIVVGAVNRDHKIAFFSNYGESVDVCAPGVDIVSYSIKPEGLESMDGTSMAAPHISALAAMLAMYVPDASPAQIEKYIKDYCQYLGDELYYGEGIPQGIFYIEN